MKKILKDSPIWVIGYDEEGENHRSSTGFVRVTAHSEFIKAQCFLECSKWGKKENAQEALRMVDSGEFFVYRVDEYEDGSDRLFLKLTKEN